MKGEPYPVLVLRQRAAWHHLLSEVFAALRLRHAATVHSLRSSDLELDADMTARKMRLQ